MSIHCDHVSGKPGNVREFETCQGKVSQNCLLLVEYLRSTPFFLHRYCCEGRYSICVPLKCLEKSGNLIMIGEWPPCLYVM